MPLTYTGRDVTLDNREYPSILDIAVGLSRMPRFAGQTRVWWSVLDHTLFGDYLLEFGQFPPGRSLRLAWLLHDAHEALTGDVPSPLKSTGLRIIQAQLDTKIYENLGRGINEHHFAQVKALDQRVLVAEAWEIGPEAGAGALTEAFPWLPETANDMSTLRYLLKGCQVGIPPQQQHQESHPAVQAYLETVARLS